MEEYISIDEYAKFRKGIQLVSEKAPEIRQSEERSGAEPSSQICLRASEKAFSLQCKCGERHRLQYNENTGVLRLLE